VENFQLLMLTILYVDLVLTTGPIFGHGC